MTEAGWQRWVPPLLRAPARVVVEVVREIINDDVLGMGAKVTFFAMLSVFPGLLVLAAALGSLGAVGGAEVATEVQDYVIDQLRSVLTQEASGAITSVRELFEQQQDNVFTLALFTALFSLSGAFAALLGALNLAYDVPERRSWWHRRLTGLALAVGSVLLALALLVSLVVGPLLGRGENLAATLGLGAVFTFLWDWVRLPAAFAVLVVWATTMCHLAPAKERTRWRHDLPGGLLTALLWLIATGGLNLYVQIASGTNPVLSALGGGLILMIWLYLLTLSILVGGELNDVLLRDRRAPAQPPDDDATARPSRPA